MGLKFLNSELQMLCVMNCKKIKLTNASVINSVTDTCIFQVNITVFIPMNIFKALKISTLNSRTFHTFPGSVRTLQYETKTHK